MALHSLLLILLLLPCLLQTGCCQSLTTHVLCTGSAVTVAASSSGVVQYTHKDNHNDICSLVMQGFVGNSFVLITGIDPISACDQYKYPNIRINQLGYCAGGLETSNNNVVIQLSDSGEMSISLLSDNSNNFTIEYYSNVAECGSNISLPGGGDVRQLSGAVVSTFTPRGDTLTANCTTHILNLPNSAVYFLGASLNVSGGSITVSGDTSITAANNTLVTSATDNQIALRYIYGGVPASFVLVFSVLRCNDLPMMDNGEFVAPPTPWFVGSMATYNCIEGYHLAGSSDFSTTCDLNDREEAEWNFQRDIRCIPEPWCHSPPTAVANSLYRLGGDNLTATYQCIDGYTTSSSVERRTSICSSVDADQNRWTWPVVDFSCTAVMCDELEIKNAKRHIDSGRLVGSVVVHACVQGFTNVGGDNVRTCVNDNGLGVWGGSDLKCKRHITPGILAAVIVSLAAVVVLAAFLYLMRSRLRRLCRERMPKLCPSAAPDDEVDVKANEPNNGQPASLTTIELAAPSAADTTETEYMPMNYPNKVPTDNNQTNSVVSDVIYEGEPEQPEEDYMEPVNKRAEGNAHNGTQGTAGINNARRDEYEQKEIGDEDTEAVYGNVGVEEEEYENLSARL